MSGPSQMPPPIPRSVSVVVVDAADDDALARSLAALESQEHPPDEVLIAASWPGPAPEPCGLSCGLSRRIVHEAGIGAAAAANAAIAAARGDLVLVLAAGDIAPFGLVAAHVAAHGRGADAVAADVAAELPARDAWVGLRPVSPPGTWSRHFSSRRSALIELDGLDDRLRDLDVAALDLLSRLAESGMTVVGRPDLRVENSAFGPARERAREAGHAAQLLDELCRVRGATSVRVGSRRAALMLRWLAPILRHGRGARGRRTALRAEFATGRGLPPLATFPHDRCGLTVTTRGVERPAVAVVVPFAGDPSSAAELTEVLASLDLRPGDEAIVADNSSGSVVGSSPGVRVVRATGERSSYHARNVGAGAATTPWILFTDGDCVPTPWILDAFFSPPPGGDVGAVAGAVLDPQDATTWIGRYSSEAAVLSQGRSLARRPRPYAVTACLLVRREALEAVGGFTEGIVSSGDVDVCWRLQDAGWRLDHRPRAAVEHRHRASLRGLVRQYRRYGAGNAWLARRWPGTEPGWPRWWRRGMGRAILVDLAAARAISARMRILDIVCEWSAALGTRRDNAPGS